MSDMFLKKEVSERDDRGFSVRIVSWEERLQWPVAELDSCFSEFSGSRVKRVPIISIFGSTPRNQSVCLHIHKVFPYFYVPFPTTLSTMPDEVVEFLRHLGSELESALNCGTQWTMQRIFNLQMVFAKSVYGFHENDDLFIKIVLYNPRDVTRAGEILQNGGIMGMKFQPFETHIPFFLQFKMDYNLYGMDMIEVSRVYFRYPSQQTTSSRLERWISTDPEDRRLSTPKAKAMTPCGTKRLDRVSSCDLEVDAIADDIMNIHKLDWRSIDDVDENTKLVQSLIPTWKMMSKPNEDPMQIDRNFKGDLSTHVDGIRQRIKQIQNQYRTRHQKKESLRQTPSCSSIHALSEGGRSSVLAANALLDKHSACACPSPIREEEMVDNVFPEEPESFTQFTRDEDDDLGLLMELADIAEEEDYIQDEEQDTKDIIASIQEVQHEEIPRTEIDQHHSNQTSQMESDGHLDDHSEEMEVIDQVTAIPVNRVPERSEIDSNLDQFITQKANQGPVYRLASDGTFNTEAWLQIPSFSNSNPIYDRLKLRFSKSVNERTSMYEENGQWIWTTSKAPPSVHEAAEWLNSTSQKDPNCSEIQQPEAPHGERPDSPDYDETSSFYHTPRSRKALSNQFPTTSTSNFKSSAFGAPSDLTVPTEAPPSSFHSRKIEPLVEDLHAEQQLVICTVEIHAASRGGLLSDPAHDAIHCILIKAMEDSNHQNSYSKILIFHPAADRIQQDWQNLMGIEKLMIKFYGNEKELLMSFIQELVALDPDVIIGFDLVKGSLGYLTERAILMGINLLNEISRMSVKRPANPLESGSGNTLMLASPGRILLNAWRVLRSEIKLNIYTFENCVAEILKIRIPKIEQCTLDSWFSSSSPIEFDRCLRHLVMKSDHLLSMMIELDLIHRTSEMARLYGIDFYSVLSRGSQYRVESMLIRLAHSQNYLMISPSKQQVYDQPAMECLPLVLEPKSEVHCDPVVVLDFQSLYPSLVIAYNLCFSTICSKNVPGMDQSTQLGVSQYWTPQSMLDGGIRSEDLIISPNGMCFTPPSIRKGILPRLLKEILETRILIKRQMKITDSTNKSLMRSLNARQFGLKMIANVSYGYSAAGFSGRMPMAEFADSIVQSGRQTLMNAIELIQTHPRWNAEVVYGDSVAEGTPLILRIDGMILIREVQELGGFGSSPWRGYRDSKEICELSGVETWTEEGWTEVHSLIRHKWNPRQPLVNVETPLGSIICTEDHSLLLKDGSEVCPWEIREGTPLMASMPHLEYYFNDQNSGFDCFFAKLLGMFVNLWNEKIVVVSKMTKRISCFAYSDERWVLEEYLDGAKQTFPDLNWTIRSDALGHELVVEGPTESKIKAFENYITSYALDKEGKAKVPDFVFNAPFKIRDAFWTGFTDGCVVWNDPKVLTEPNPRLSLGLMFLASSKCCYPYMTDKGIYLGCQQLEKKATVTRKEYVHQTGGYVYDLRTLNHHFQAGTGALIVHNTDSVFVKLRDCSRSKAFEIGNEIADAVTRSNPAPVELKMEKVYHPCVLLTKKHYVGHSYTAPDQTQPQFDAKGIETIRRDSCPAVAKILEKTLTFLFNEKDFSQIRTYLERQWSKILTGGVNLKDFIFSKEVRVGRYRSRVLPPAAVVAAEAQRLDPRRFPQPGERVPYLVVYGHPGQRLVDLVVEPQKLILSSGDLKLNALYYIKKQINPALDRVLSLSRVSVQDWFMRMPGSIRKSQLKTRGDVKRQKTIDTYFLSRHCPICDDVTSDTGILCRNCRKDGQKSMGVISTKLNRLESQLTAVECICRHCFSSPSTNLCQSLDCALYFDRIKLNEELKTTRQCFDQITELF